MPAKTKDPAAEARAANRRQAKRELASHRIAPTEVQCAAQTSARQWVFAAVLAAMTLAMYWPVTNHPFANYDDPEYVIDNVHVHQGLTLATLRWAFTATEQSNWHPLTWLSHALDYELFGANSAGHHATSLLLHVINVLLLFWILHRATRAVGRSAMVAAIFALHPMNVESVAWIAERKNLLCTMFFLLALAAYGWYAQNPNRKRYAAMAGLFACALAAKPMAITFPFVLLLLDYWPLQRIAGYVPCSETLPIPQMHLPRLLLEKLPLLLLSAVSAVMTILAQRDSIAPVQQFGYGARVENAIWSYLMYLAKAFWPVDLALFYPHPGNTLLGWKVALAALVLVAVTVLVWSIPSRAFPLVGWCWYLGTLIIVIGIVQAGAQSMADRYAYIPLIGIFVLVVWGAADVARDRGISIATQRILAAAILLALALATWRQVGYWNSDYDLWTHALDVTGNNLMAEDKLGVALQAMGRQDDAVPHFANALRLDPLDPLSNFDIGADLHWHGRIQEAIPHYETAIQQTTNSRLLADAYQNLGTAYSQLGDRSKARENFLLALAANPELTTVFAGLGELENEPIAALSRAVVEHPSAEGFLHLGRLFQQAGRLPEAHLAYARALRLDPQLRDAEQAAPGLNGSVR